MECNHRWSSSKACLIQYKDPELNRHHCMYIKGHKNKHVCIDCKAKSPNIKKD